MDINLNLPTLPTQDEKDAMDGANSPDATNVFITANDLALKVPYTGANADVNLGEFGIQLGNLEFDNTPTNVPTGAGSLNWNDTDGTLDLKLKGGNVTLQIGQEQVTRVVNKTATNITLLEANYQAVRITGAQGQRLKVDLALATTDVLSAETIGLVTETIANNAEGFITTSGLVRGINTTGSLQSETWADGDILYLSGTTAGKITNIKPVAPIHLIVIGYVVYSHITQGTIYVKVDNGYELGELHNVYINGVADNNLLAYESSTTLWKNKTSSSLGLAPLASPTFTGTVVLPATTSIGTVSNTEIGYLDGVTSAIQTQIDSKSALGFTIQTVLSSQNFNPADATTYYIGTFFTTTAVTISTSRKIFIPKNCTLKNVYISSYFVNGTNELSTLYFRLNNTTDTVISSAINLSSAPFSDANTSLNIALIVGDYFELKWITPTWVTNPTTLTFSAILYFE